MTPLLEVKALDVRYHTRSGVLHAVDRVDLSVRAGETMGLVGESGCGKSSLGKAIMRLVDPHSGSIRLDGIDITRLSGRHLRPHRRRFQMVFQDPAASLNPRQRVSDLLEEPLALYRIGNRTERRARVRELMDQVGLPVNVGGRLPHEFSGGQRQRIAIARALALEPSLIVCDEPVSALDVSLQAQILNLLSDLQRSHGVAYLFISHDLSVVQHLADRIAVMYLGQIIEIASRAELWRRPAHPYTQALIAAVPLMDPGRRRNDRGRLLPGDLPNPHQPPAGCRFHTRCSFAMPSCREHAPTLTQITPDHAVACHLHADGSADVQVIEPKKGHA